MHEVLVNRLGGLSLSRKSVVRLTDRPDMTLDVYQGCKTTTTTHPVVLGGSLLLFNIHGVLSIVQSICRSRIRSYAIPMMANDITVNDS